jgi:hypothetical protein
MVKRVLLGLGSIALFAVGCSTDTQDFCARLDECNFIKTGNSVEDCVNDMDHGLEDLSSSEQRDAERIMDDCLSFESCAGFTGCIGGNRLLPY